MNERTDIERASAGCRVRAQEPKNVFVKLESKLLTCDGCGADRTLHPSGNFYECVPCHQKKIAMQVALNRVYDYIAISDREYREKYPVPAGGHLEAVIEILKSAMGIA